MDHRRTPTQRRERSARKLCIGVVHSRQSALHHDEGDVWTANSLRCSETTNEFTTVGGFQELATTIADPHQGHELGLGSSNDPCVCGSALVVSINSNRNEFHMMYRQSIAACFLMLLLLAGCESGSSTSVPYQHLNPNNHQPTAGATTSTQLDRIAWPGQLCPCLAGEPSALAQQV